MKKTDDLDVLTLWKRRDASGETFVPNARLYALNEIEDLPEGVRAIAKSGGTEQPPSSAVPGVLPTAPAVAAQPGNDITNFRVSQVYSSTDASTGASGGGAGASTDMNSFSITYEAMVETAPSPTLNVIGNQVYETVKVIGVRLELQVETVKARFHADFFSVAVAAELGWANVSFASEIHPADGLADLLPPQGKYDITKYQDILDGIIRVKQKLGAIDGLLPDLYYRPTRLVFTGDDELAEAAAVCFAAVSLVRKTKLNDALHDAQKRNIRPAVVRAAYGYFWPEGKDADSPPDAVRGAARRWLGW